MLLNCGVGEDSWESLGLHGDHIIKEISSEYSLEGLMLKLKLKYLATWCEGQTHWKRPWCWERLRAGGEGEDRDWNCQMASPTQWTGHEFKQAQGIGDGQRSLACCSPWCCKELDITEWMNWTEQILFSFTFNQEWNLKDKPLKCLL